jgi:hypothetical protein
MVIINNTTVDSKRFLAEQLADFENSYGSRLSIQECQFDLARKYRRAANERRNVSHHIILGIRKKLGIRMNQLFHLYWKLSNLNGGRISLAFIQMEILADDIRMDLLKGATR